MGWSDLFWESASSETAKKKKRRDTGAKNVSRSANGPGLSLRGSSMPMLAPVSIDEKFHSPRQPPGDLVCDEGDRVPAGKSTSGVLASTARWKSLARPAAPPRPASG